MDRTTAVLVAALMLSGCARQNSREEQIGDPRAQLEPRAPSEASALEARREKLAFLQDSQPTTWRVALLSIAVCPSAADWYPGAEAIQRLEFDKLPDLSDDCWRLKKGETVKLPPAGKRKIEIHADHVIMQAFTGTGREFWTDELDQLAIEPVT